jgi:hypothetical protein
MEENPYSNNRLTLQVQKRGFNKENAFKKLIVLKDKTTNVQT